MGSRLRAVLLGSSALVLVACAAVLAGRERGAVEPGPRGVGRPGASEEAPAASASASNEVEELARPEDFRPLLAEEAYFATREALDAGEGGRAARAAFEIATTAAVDRASRFFLAAVLADEAGEGELAERAYREVLAAVDSRLAPDAALRLGERVLERKDFDAVRRFLAQAGPTAGSSRYERLRLRLVLRAEGPDMVASALSARGGSADGLTEEILETLAARAFAEEDVQRRRSFATLALGSHRAASVGVRAKSERARRLEELRRRLVEIVPIEDGSRSLGEWLAHLQALVDGGAHAEVVERVREIPRGRSAEAPREECELALVLGKAHAGLREWGRAFEALEPEVKRCAGFPEVHVKLLFNAGKYAGADGREAKAGSLFEELERRYSENSLADDARVRRAQSALDSGSVARFTELLLRIADDYPNGDMTMEGVFLLALHRMERRDWAGAELVLERATKVVSSRDAARGQEFAGTEAYFLARARGQLGDREGELTRYEELVRTCPLSYYTLHAYSRLAVVDPARAHRAIEDGMTRATTEALTIADIPRNRPAALRGLELLRVGALAEGEELLLRELGESATSTLWGLARIFERAGDARIAHDLARRKLTDWLLRYPAGDWRTAWEIAFPRPYLPIVERESAATGVPPWFVYGIMREESLFDPRAKSPANAFGLMQLIEPTARGVGRKANLPYSRAALLTPHGNIPLGTRVLENLGRQFQKNPWLAIPGYNAGPGRPVEWLKKRPEVDFDLWVELIPFRETRRYTKRVLASRAAYAFLYYPEGREEALRLPERLELP